VEPAVGSRHLAVRSPGGSPLQSREGGQQRPLVVSRRHSQRRLPGGKRIEHGS
jgi:hypothetical protein